MNEKSLKRGNELEKEMSVIRLALQDLTRPPKKGEKHEEYWLCVSAHKDGSGQFCDLIGANVATAVLQVIHTELERQLAAREQEFKAL